MRRRANLLINADGQLVDSRGGQAWGGVPAAVDGATGQLAEPQAPTTHTHPAEDLPTATTTALGVVELATDGESAANVAVQGNDARMSNARTPTAHDIITAHNGFPGGTTNFLRADGTFAAPPGGGGGLTLTPVEVNLGTAERRAGRFTITGAGLTAGKPVLIQQAVGPYTGKGTRADEAEMDQLVLSAAVLNTTTIEAFWNSHHKVRGNMKFNYAVSA